ncbi:MAG: hypothetical protein FJ087_19750 [Deltaproteobacteria bacterium]|nr:hypothetical protein [Deltaproteobacteria bacterium]
MSWSSLNFSQSVAQPSQTSAQVLAMFRENRDPRISRSPADAQSIAQSRSRVTWETSACGPPIVRQCVTVVLQEPSQPLHASMHLWTLGSIP